MTDTEIRSLFPELMNERDGRRMVYLDSAATSQRPSEVIEAVGSFYANDNANPHRGTYLEAEKATEVYEEARNRTASFIGAESRDVIFTRNTSEAMNLLAYTWGAENVGAGDRVVITIMEHHSNLLPWQRLCRMKGAELVYLYLNDSFEITDSEIEEKINADTKLVAFTHVSNVLGVMPPVGKIISRAKETGAVTVMDCAQSVPHMKVDVNELGADFIAFSGHKMFAPFGIGALWGRDELLESMPPFLSGGEMIEYVREQDATWAPLPQKFEAGTQDPGAAAGLLAAISFMERIGMDVIAQRERDVYDYALSRLSELDHVEVYGPADRERFGAIPFNVKDVHPHDTATVLSADRVCVRAGHHCAQPLLKSMGLNSCCRISFSVYNSREDVDLLCDSLKKVRGRLGL
ncbi:MAG: SufS family cysteine desulfurase [Lachnospiraceae bacterium]|nr:SufS family cysteine desulfurase [Lachnospiraceae bacterium]